MGLTKEVRSFFQNKINSVLDRKLKDLKSGIDVDALKTECINLFCKETGISLSTVQWLEQVENDIQKLEAEKAEVKDKIRTKMRKADKFFSNYYYGFTAEEVYKTAYEKMQEQAIKSLYPELIPQIEKINEIRDDVYGTILLATTERKLVETLTRLLNNYGGDIKELLDLIPSQE